MFKAIVKQEFVFAQFASQLYCGDPSAVPEIQGEAMPTMIVIKQALCYTWFISKIFQGILTIRLLYESPYDWRRWDVGQSYLP